MPRKARLTLCLSRFILIASLSALGLAPLFCLCPDSSDSSTCHFSPALGALPSFRCTFWGFISLSMPCQERLRGVLFRGSGETQLYHSTTTVLGDPGVTQTHSALWPHLKKRVAGLIEPRFLPLQKPITNVFMERVL